MHVYSVLGDQAFGGGGGIVKVLIELGANVHTEAKDGQTPLLAAAVDGHEATVKVLMGMGYKVNAQDALGNTYILLKVMGMRR
jgi:ankyrin repeat protein